MNNIIYEGILKAYNGDVCIFQDEDRELTLKEIKKYRQKNGYSIETNKGRFTIRNIVLRERTLTGEVISEIPYCKLFDVLGNRIKED